MIFYNLHPLLFILLPFGAYSFTGIVGCFSSFTYLKILL